MRERGLAAIEEDRHACQRKYEHAYELELEQEHEQHERSRTRGFERSVCQEGSQTGT